MTDSNTTLPSELILEDHEEVQNISLMPILTPIHEDTDEDSDDCSSLPDLIYCTGDSCSFGPIIEEDDCASFGVDIQNIQPEQPIDYNDEEIEKREERYENWKQNRRTFYPRPKSTLFKENVK